MSLGSRLKELRIKKRMTRRQLSDELGITQSTIQKIEEGYVPNPGIYTVKKMADRLGITLNKAVRDE